MHSWLIRFRAPVFAGALALTSCSPKRDLPSGFGVTYVGRSGTVVLKLTKDWTFHYTWADTADSVPRLEVDGTYIRNIRDSGFVKLTVTDARGSPAPAPGIVAHALELMGAATFMRPFGTEATGLISLAASGYCPNRAMDSNWIDLGSGVGAPDRDATVSTNDFYGSFAFDPSAGIASFPARSGLEAFMNLGALAIDGTGICDKGVFAPNDDYRIRLTPFGGALIETGDGRDLIAAPRTEIKRFKSLSGTYVGLVSDASIDAAAPERVAATEWTFDEAHGDAYAYTDEEFTKSTDALASIDFLEMNAPGEGFARGSLSMMGGLGAVACSFSFKLAGSDSSLVTCVGQGQADRTKSFNAILITKPEPIRE